ncbi:MAG TPA: TetR/AcrR family transcriptional regulator [Bacteroidota bacterium]
MGIHERKEREKEQRREEILNAAQAVFFEKGLQNSTMDEIAVQAELSKGTIYLYYGSKEDLYLAVMLRGFDALHQAILETIETSSNSLEAMRRMGTTYYDFYEKQRNYFRMFHFLQYPGLHKQVSPEMMETCNTHTQKIWKLVIDTFQKGIHEKIFRSDISPVEAAVVLWSNANSILLRIDNEYDRWKQTLNIDLVNVYFRSNSLFLQALMTPQAQEQYSAVLHNDPIAATT